MRSGRQRRSVVFSAALAMMSLSGCGLLDNGDDSAAAGDEAIPVATAAPVPVAAFSGVPTAQALWNSMAQDPNVLTMKCTEWLQTQRLLLRQMSSRLAA